MKGLDFGVAVVISVMVTSYFSGCSVDVCEGDDDDDGCCSLAGVLLCRLLGVFATAAGA